MTDFILQNELKIRLIGFLGTFAIMAILEAIFPRRKRVDTRLHRWTANFGIIISSSITANIFFRFIFIGTLVQFASMVQNKGWGLFNYFIPLATDASTWESLVYIIKGVVIMDLIIYFQHRFAHSNKYIWQVHKVHHADMDLDVTSGNRFHPIEILFSIFVKIVAIITLGIHPVSIIIFEVILNGLAQWNHANLKLPLWCDRLLRKFLVTPDFHRVHHSIVVKETNSNYGFNLTWWDYLFGTYEAQPVAGHDNMEIGIKEYRDPKELGFINLFRIPYDHLAEEYAKAGNKEDVQFDEQGKPIE